MGKHSRYRALISAGVGLGLILALALGAGEPRATAAALPSTTVAQQTANDSTSFQNLNGFLWFYNTYFNYKYSDIEPHRPRLLLEAVVRPRIRLPASRQSGRGGQDRRVLALHRTGRLHVGRRQYQPADPTLQRHHPRDVHHD